MFAAFDSTTNLLPRGVVVVLPVAAVEGSVICNHSFDRAAGEGVVGDAKGDDGAFGEVADVLPAEGDAGLGRRGTCLPVVVNRLGKPGGDVPEWGPGCGGCSWCRP